MAIVVALAWTYLFYVEREMSASMAYDAEMAAMGMMDEPWTTVDVVFTFFMWAVMMAGMMAGTATPVLLLFAASRAKRPMPGARVAVLMFGMGYLLVWVGFSAVAALTQWGLHEKALMTPMMTASSPYLAGGILIVAGLYQLTPLKSACLIQCQSPLGFLMSHWREGAFGALRMGFHHGLFCLGCCWALMAVLFAVGVMNLLWVAALSALVLVEKVGPADKLMARATGAALVICGIAKIVTAR